MRQPSTQQWLNQRFGEPERFNTNNAWGFGGGIGLIWRDENIQIKIGTAYFRHLPPKSFCSIVKDGYIVFDKQGATINEIKAAIGELEEEPA